MVMLPYLEKCTVFDLTDWFKFMELDDQLIRLKQIDPIALSKYLLYIKRICVLPSRQAKWKSLKKYAIINLELSRLQAY